MALIAAMSRLKTVSVACSGRGAKTTVVRELSVNRLGHQR